MKEVTVSGVVVAMIIVYVLGLATMHIYLKKVLLFTVRHDVVTTMRPVNLDGSVFSCPKCYAKIALRYSIATEHFTDGTKVE